MQPDSLLIVFVGIIAFAALAQCIALVIVSLGLKHLSARVDGLSKDLLKQVNALSAKAEDMFAEVKAVAAGMEAVRDNLVHSTALIRSRVIEADAFLDEVLKDTRRQVAAVQDFLDTSARKIQETFDIVQGSIIGPIKEIGALITGFRVGLDVLLGRRRRPVDKFRHDEEMFI